MTVYVCIEKTYFDGRLVRKGEKVNSRDLSKNPNFKPEKEDTSKSAGKEVV